MTTIYLIRHGEALNKQKILAGMLPLGLSAKGKVQAKKAAKAISGPVAVIYASPVLRALQTAKIIAKTLNAPLKQEFLIREWTIKNWEGLAKSSVEGSNEWNLFMKHPTRLKRGERITSVARRMLKAYQSAVKKHPNKTIVFVSHRDPIAALCCLLTKTHLDKIHKQKGYPTPGGVIKLNVEKRTLQKIL